MKSTCFFLLMIMCGTISSNAQISMQPVIPVVGLVQSEHLWNITIVNSSPKQYECRIGLILKDRNTGQDIASATSGQFTLSPGAKQITAGAIAPIQYNFYNSGQLNSVGLLSAGSYIACYSLFSVGLKETSISDECIQFDTEPLSPPMLSFPTDSSVLEVAPNQFSWIPPTPSGMFVELKYDVLMVEINEGQKATEAIEENLPFYNTGSHLSNVLSYPVASMPFEKEKWYAWQIIARDNREYAGKSEVWVFKMTTPGKPKPNPINYVQLKKSLTDASTYYLSEHNLDLKYYSYDRPFISMIRFKHSNGKLIKEIQKEIIYGDNLFNFKLDRLFRVGELYTIELVDARGISHIAQFSIK